MMPKVFSQESSGILIFGLMPYLSLFTVETHKYLQSTFPSYAHTLLQDNYEIINASRMRTKFFDDTKMRVDGTFELLKWIIDFNEEWHIGGHKGWLAPLKRALQGDLLTFTKVG